MVQHKPRIAILGGGIRGTAIAALLAHSQLYEVVLVERESIGAGTSSTNHGRIHCGAGLWKKNVPSLAYRHRIGGELIRQLSADIARQLEALYLVHSPADAEKFEQACQHYEINYQHTHASSIFIDTSPFAAAFEIPEYTFRPARLAGQLALYARETGAEIAIHAGVSALEAGTQRQFMLHLADGEQLEADIVINTLGIWANHVASHLPLPRAVFHWQRWRILCLDASEGDYPSHELRVITVVEADDMLPSLVPHFPWMLFGCRVEPDTLSDIDERYSGAWQMFDQNHPMDRALLTAHANYFRPLQHLNEQQLKRRLYTFAGVYPAFAGMYPHYQVRADTNFHLLQSSGVPDYYVVYGENATTCLIDAVDVVHEIMLHANREVSYQHILGFIPQIGSKLNGIYDPTAAMVWESSAIYT